MRTQSAQQSAAARVPDPRRSRVPLGLLSVGLLALAASCVSAGTVQSRSQELDTLLLRIQQPAAICAPRELATAEAFVEFARHESSAGHTLYAKMYLDRAHKAAQEAFVKSNFDYCEPDTDNDEIRDSLDRCPKEQEDFDLIQDEDGCPDFDRDNDGVMDDVDRCPDIQEDRDGFQDEDGCPDPDNDQDGIPDARDQCPNDPEDRDGFQDEDGCPDADNDQDGILDTADGCPNEAEDKDGDRDDDGCPDVYQNVVIADDEIKIMQEVLFQHGRSRILSESFGLLEEVAKAMRDNPTFRVEIQGHTSSVGSDRSNLALSRKRAKAVWSHMTGINRIPKARLSWQGYGESQLLCIEETEACHAKNRRVVFKILSR